jgi:hypothetical protein
MKTLLLDALGLLCAISTALATTAILYLLIE